MNCCIQLVLLSVLGFASCTQVQIEPVQAESAQTEASSKTALKMPTPRAGLDILGRNVAPAFDDIAWVGDACSLTSTDGPRATLVRFWTDTCPFCAKSLPAIEAMREDYAARGLRTIGVYHPKPPRDVASAEVTDNAQRLGFSGSLAMDPDWALLRKLWLDEHPRTPTSISLLLDAEGRVRFMHPGPQFFASDDPADAQEAQDEREMRQAIEFLLQEQSSE